MDRHSSYTAPRSGRSPASRGSRRSPKRSSGRSGNENRFLHNLLWYVLPFIIFNLLLLFLVTASPRIELTVGDTSDYKTVDVSFKVKSLIPIRKLTTTLESQNIEFKKEGGVYHASLTNNGALEIYVESWNGMPARQNEHIAVLDDTAPSIDEENVVMEDGKLELIAEDNISGVNYEAVYAVDEAGKKTAPLSYDKETGRITFDLEKGSLTVYLEDMAGNANQAAFSLSTSGIDTDSRETDFPEDGENGTNGNKKEDDDEKTSNSDKKKTSKSTEAAKSTKASKNTEAAKSTKASKNTEASKATKASKNTETTKASKSTEASKTQKGTEASKSTKAPKNTEAAKSTKASKSTEATKKSTEAPKTTQASKNAETSKAASSKSTEASKPAETTKATQESKPAQSAPASETMPVIEPLH